MCDRSANLRTYHGRREVLEVALCELHDRCWCVFSSPSAAHLALHGEERVPPEISLVLLGEDLGGETPLDCWLTMVLDPFLLIRFVARRQVVLPLLHL